MADVVEFNILTKEVIERPFTEAEKLAYENEQEIAKREEIELVAKQKAKKEVLNKLGITEDEAKLLLS